MFRGKLFLHNQEEEYYQSTKDFMQPKNEKQDWYIMRIKDSLEIVDAVNF